MSAILTFVIMLPLIGFWIWMFSDFLLTDRTPTEVRTKWLIGFIFVGIFAAAYYYRKIYRAN